MPNAEPVNTPPGLPPSPSTRSSGGPCKRRARAKLYLGLGVFALLLGWSSWQAIIRLSDPPMLAAVEDDPQTPQPTTTAGATQIPVPPVPPTAQDTRATDDSLAAAPDLTHPSQTRAAGLIVNGRPWTGPTFDGRPIAPARTVTLRTTAYSPDERSCGIWADGYTASGMSVWTNGMKLAAADPSIPFGTLLTVPGYNDNQPIPVLDRGGAIKGDRLDLLYPTHDAARQWGVQDLEVVVWEYADGQ